MKVPFRRQLSGNGRRSLITSPLISTAVVRLSKLKRLGRNFGTVRLAACCCSRRKADIPEVGAFTVPFDKIALLNKSSIDQDYRQVHTERGMEVGALLEGAHQIHCLNLARQYIYRDDWDYSGLQSFGGGKRVQRHHVDHCLSTLLIIIKCWSDVTPFLVEHTGHGLVKRGSHHRCKRFDKLVNWVNEHVAFDAAAE